MVRLQAQIKNNHADITSYIEDLVTWTEDATVKEKNLKKTQTTKTATVPPIRNKIDIEQSLKPKAKGGMPNVPELEKYKRDNTAMPGYYAAWDKFAKKLDDCDDDVEDAGYVKPVAPKEPQNAAEMMARTSGAAPNTSIVIKGGQRKQVSLAEEFKQQGNSYFVSLEYSNSIDCYSKCLKALDDFPTTKAADQEMRKLTYSNRAQAYLKLKVYQKAFEDANTALLIDSNHIKSIGRRGTAAYYLKKFKQAKIDFIRGLQLEPENQQFSEYLKKTLEKF